MSRYVAPVAVPAEARELVDAITASGARFWSTLAELNRRDREGKRRTMRADIDGLLAESTARDELLEQLRKRFLPRASRVTADKWGVYTWSPTGRVVRMVWKIEQAPAFVD